MIRFFLFTPLSLDSEFQGNYDSPKFYRLRAYGERSVWAWNFWAKRGRFGPKNCLDVSLSCVPDYHPHWELWGRPGVEFVQYPVKYQACHYAYLLNLVLQWFSCFRHIIYTFYNKRWNVLESFGRPGPIETVKILPDIFKTGTSPWPATNFTVRVPPPPHPSFFTVKSKLKQNLF